MSSIHADPPPLVVTEPTGTQYTTGPALGKGGFAICHRAERYENNTPTGHLVALKIVKSKMEPAKLAQKFVTELQIHSKLAHPNIVTFYRAFSFENSTYVVLQLCPNGSLADMLRRRKHLTLPEIRRFVIQICGAVKYLHQRHIVHRDLKTGNLFLDANMNIKVGDFGLAALLVSTKEMEVTRRTTMCGTPNYLAPEILQKDKGHNEKVDLWAIGIISYTLAVGKAPFHANTKEEIYKKLKTGSYTWPELNATAHQNGDLRALVSELLVPEEQRLSPDKIVSHNFFRIAYVPPVIPTSARERAPVWPEPAVPSPQILQNGYSDTWYDLCKDSGVGEPVSGLAFSLNRGRKIKSIVHDMAKEAQAGRQPTMPLPDDLVYISPVSDWDGMLSNTSETGPAPPRRSRELREITANEVALARAPKLDAKMADDALMMPPPVRPPPRSSRATTVRKAARTISEEKETAGEMIKVAQDASSNSNTASSSNTMDIENRTSKQHRKSPSESAGNGVASTIPVTTHSSQPEVLRRSADASLARRPRSTRAQMQPIASGEPRRTVTLDELKRASPLKKISRKRTVEVDMVEVHEDCSGERKSSLSDPVRKLDMGPAAKRKCDGLHALDGTEPDAVLRQVTLLCQNLTSILTKQRAELMPDLPSTRTLPFVTRWVDYSRKHGVGYVLSNGTVGCIINSSTKNDNPVTHVLVREGRKWLNRVGKTFESIDRVPFEIFEDCNERGIMPKVYKGLGGVKDGPLAAECERRRILSVLWVKFGRYMCQSLEGNETAVKEDQHNFVRFYQRIGNVGIWAFADGCLQVHFPDHTKLVISADGRHISATCISAEAAAYLTTHSELLPHHVATREVFEDGIASLLFGGSRIRMRVIKANVIQEKLTYVLLIANQWINNGGLGRLDQDAIEQGCAELYWNGLTADESARKTDRVTVGRHGGDEGVKQIFVA